MAGGLRRLGPLGLSTLAVAGATATLLAASPPTRRSVSSAAGAAGRAAQFLALGSIRYTAGAYEAAARRWATDGSDALVATATLTGKHYVVSGANTGLGLEVARGLAARGGVVHLLCRSERRGRAAVEELVVDGAAAAAAGGDVDRRAAEADFRRRVLLHVVDISSLASIDTFAAGYLADGTPLHGLVNNAGVMLDTVIPSADGLESVFATNTLGTFALTERLLPAAVATPGPSVVVVVSSAGMLTADLVVKGVAAAATVRGSSPPASPAAREASQPAGGDSSTLAAGARQDGSAVYAVTKRQQLALVEAWAATAPPGVAFHSCHPGWADTGGVRTSMPGFHRVFERQLRTPTQGADTPLWLTIVGTATAPTGGDSGGTTVIAEADAPQLPPLPLLQTGSGSGGAEAAGDPWAAARAHLGSGGFWFDRAPAAKHLWLGGTRYEESAPAALVAELRSLVDAKGRGV
ncbi:hypothetical protein MMPV_003854 [Pyropia vietnamensis]